jgi:uncharacterized protein
MSYALITGASKGIGEAIAYKLAAKGHDLLLVARSGDLLTKLAAALAEKHKITVHVLAIDLSESTAPGAVAAWAESKGPVNILVNNAGYGLWGKFGTLPLEEQLNMLQLNVISLISLTHLLLPVLKRFERSYVLNVASTTAYQAVPGMSAYAASKAFVLSFSRGLRHELKDTGVSVTVVSPGATDTHFMERAEMQALEETAKKVIMTPEAVAEAAVKGLFVRNAEVIPGAINKINAASVRFAPKSLVEAVAWGIYKKD